MATDKKHIAVYLDPAVEQALIAFCEQRGLKSKKGTMFSAGVNAVLAEFFGVSDTETGSIPQEANNIPNRDNIPSGFDNIPVTCAGNIPPYSKIPFESLAMEVLPGKQKA
jgi:hypothetical protein